MWLSILAVAVISIFEHISLKTYRIYGELPPKVKKGDLRILWISSIVIAVIILLCMYGLPTIRII